MHFFSMCLCCGTADHNAHNCEIMAERIARPCRYGRCIELTNDGYCEQHRKQRQNERGARERNTEAQKFYNSVRWRAKSKAHLRANPFCVECNRVATLTDHKTPIDWNAEQVHKYWLMWSRENRQSMCDVCHNRKRGRERHE